MNTRPLTIVTSKEDDTTRGIRAAVRETRIASNSLNVLNILREELKQGTAGRWSSLDLVGHTVGLHSYEQIGQWIISKSDNDDDDDPTDDHMRNFAVKKLRPLLLELEIGCLRLLGCGTATTMQNFSTMKSFEKRLSAPHQDPYEIYGTSTAIDQSDFAEDGFSSTSKLYSSKEATHALTRYFTKDILLDLQLKLTLNRELLRPEEIDTMPVVSWPRSIVSRETAVKIWNMIEKDVAWSLPGLLALPSQEILIPVRNNESYHRIEVLLNHQIVRFFFLPPHDREFLIYRVTNPEHLASLLHSLG